MKIVAMCVEVFGIVSKSLVNKTGGIKNTGKNRNEDISVPESH